MERRTEGRRFQYGGAAVRWGGGPLVLGPLSVGLLGGGARGNRTNDPDGFGRPSCCPEFYVFFFSKLRDLFIFPTASLGCLIISI